MGDIRAGLFPSCHDGSGLSVLIQLHYYWSFLHPSKSKRRDGHGADRNYVKWKKIS